MLLQRLGSLLWRRFNPWPRNLPMPLERPHSTSCMKAAPREHAGGVSGVGGAGGSSVGLRGCPAPASGWGGELRGSELEFKVGLIQASLEANPRPQL